MERYRQQFPKLITIEDWLAKAHPGTPPLPWIADNGREVCSFAIVPIEGTGGILVVLYDAHGRKIVRSADVAAIEATALALNATPGELAFLPAAIRMQRSE